MRLRRTVASALAAMLMLSSVPEAVFAEEGFTVEAQQEAAGEILPEAAEGAEAAGEILPEEAAAADAAAVEEAQEDFADDAALETAEDAPEMEIPETSGDGADELIEEFIEDDEITEPEEADEELGEIAFDGSLMEEDLEEEAAELAEDREQVGTVNFATWYQKLSLDDGTSCEGYYSQWLFQKPGTTSTGFNYFNKQQCMDHAIVYSVPIYENTDITELPWVNPVLDGQNSGELYIAGWADQDDIPVAFENNNNRYTLKPDSLPRNDETVTYHPVLKVKRNGYWKLKVNDSVMGKLQTGSDANWYDFSPGYSMLSNEEGFLETNVRAVANDHYRFDHWEVNGNRIDIPENEDENIFPTDYQFPAFVKTGGGDIEAVFTIDGSADQFTTVIYEAKGSPGGYVRSTGFENLISYETKIFPGDPLPSVTPFKDPSEKICFDRWELEDGTVLLKQIRTYGPQYNSYQTLSSYEQKEKIDVQAGDTIRIYAYFIPSETVRLTLQTSSTAFGEIRLSKGATSGDFYHIWSNEYRYMYNAEIQAVPKEHCHLDHLEMSWGDDQKYPPVIFDKDSIISTDPLDTNPSWKQIPLKGDTEHVYLTAFFETDEDYLESVGRVIYEADENGALEDLNALGSISKKVEVIGPEDAQMPSCKAIRHPYSGGLVTIPENYHFLEWQDEEGNCVSGGNELEFTAPNPGVGKTARYKAVYVKDEKVTIHYTSTSNVYGHIYNMGEYDHYGSSATELTGRSYAVNFGQSLGLSDTIVAVANDGYRFTGWTINDEAFSDDPIILSSTNLKLLAGDYYVTANFEPVDPSNMGTLIAKAQDPGKIMEGSEQVSELSLYVKQGGEVPTLKAADVDNYHFLYWVDEDGKVVGTDKTLQVPVIPAAGQTVTYTACFGENQVFNVKLLVNNDYGKIAHNNNPNSNLTGSVRPTIAETGRLNASVRAIPAPKSDGSDESDYVFDHWELNGETLEHTSEIILSNATDVVYTKDSTLMAVFRFKDKSTIGKVSYTAGENGSVTYTEDLVADTETALKGSKAKPDSGYKVEGWYLDGNKVSTDATLVPAYSDVIDAVKAGRTPVYEARFVKKEAAPDSDLSGDAGSSGQPSSGDGTIAGSVVGKPLASADPVILGAAGDEAPEGADFGKLTLRAVSSTKNSIKLKWNSVSGASGYVLYGAQCKQKMQRIGLAAGTSYSVKKLKKGTYYKYMAVAIDANQKVLACSRTVHEATAGGKVGNPKKVTTRKSKLTLKKGKSAKLGGKIIKPSGKKVRTHRKLLYESSNEAVATVTKAGKVKAVGKGNCVIYVYAQNGLFKKVKVKVK